MRISTMDFYNILNPNEQYQLMYGIGQIPGFSQVATAHWLLIPSMSQADFDLVVSDLNSNGLLDYEARFDELMANPLRPDIGD